MNRLSQHIRTLLRIGTGISFLVLIIAVAIQVSARNFGTSPVWTEELARYALLYLAGFGTGLALLTGDLVNVDLVSESLPGRFPWLLRLISALLVLPFCLLLVLPAWKFTSIGAMQTSPAMGVPMNYVHGSILLLLVVLAFAALARCIEMLTGASDGRPENLSGEIE